MGDLAPWDELPYFQPAKYAQYSVASAAYTDLDITGDPMCVLLVFNNTSATAINCELWPFRPSTPVASTVAAITLPIQSPWIVVDKAAWGALTTTRWVGAGSSGTTLSVMSLSLARWPRASKTAPDTTAIQESINGLRRDIRYLVNRAESPQDRLSRILIQRFGSPDTLLANRSQP